MNAGSAGRPKDGDPRATYVVLRCPFEGPVEVKIRRVGYDVEAAAHAVVAAGLPISLAEALRHGH